jgi:uncharacterized membrane protein
MKDILGIGRTDWKTWLLYVAVIMSYLGASTAFITLATNDPRAYQPAYVQSMFLCAAAIVMALTFMFKYKGRKRTLALVPICLSLSGICNVLIRWPVVFG